jgi:uncharacterized protein YukE
MASVSGDPDELERFAHALQRFTDSIDREASSLDAAFSSLGDTWQDAKREQFEVDYRMLRHQLEQFKVNTEEQVPHLNRLASRLRDYLQS